MAAHVDWKEAFELKNEEMDMLSAIEESRLSAGMKPCHTCKKWTRSPMRSPTYKDCPHSACCLKCVTAMEHAFVNRKLEMLSSAASNSSNAIDSQTHTAPRGNVEEILPTGEVWHEEEIADDGFNAAAFLLRHHLPWMYGSDDIPDGKATVSQVRMWLSRALKQDLNLDQMPRSEDGLRPIQANDIETLNEFIKRRCNQVPAALVEFTMAGVTFPQKLKNQVVQETRIEP